jgi:hypothetical protein
VTYTIQESPRTQCIEITSHTARRELALANQLHVARRGRGYRVYQLDGQRELYVAAPERSDCVHTIGRCETCA